VEDQRFFEAMFSLKFSSKLPLFRLRTLPKHQILRIFIVSAHNLIQYHFPEAMVSGVTEGRREFKRRLVAQ
jgi:hypothetical protein